MCAYMYLETVLKKIHAKFLLGYRIWGHLNFFAYQLFIMMIYFTMN